MLSIEPVMVRLGKVSNTVKNNHMNSLELDIVAHRDLLEKNASVDKSCNLQCFISSLSPDHVDTSVSPKSQFEKQSQKQNSGKNADKILHHL